MERSTFNEFRIILWKKRDNKTANHKLEKKPKYKNKT